MESHDISKVELDWWSFDSIFCPLSVRTIPFLIIKLQRRNLKMKKKWIIWFAFEWKTNIAFKLYTQHKPPLLFTILMEIYSDDVYYDWRCDSDCLALGQISKILIGLHYCSLLNLNQITWKYTLLIVLGCKALRVGKSMVKYFVIESWSVDKVTNALKL